MRSGSAFRRSIIFAGEAGGGIDRTAVILGQALSVAGFFVFIYRDYASLIRGGHNFSVVTFSSSPVRSHESKADLLVAFDRASVEIHGGDLKPDGMIVSSEDFGVAVDQIIGQKELAKAEGAPVNFGNNAALGAVAKIFGLPFGALQKAIKTSFSSGDFSTAIKLARSGYGGSEKKFEIGSIKTGGKMNIMDGSEAAARGSLATGKAKAFYYPMTPATGYFTKLQDLGSDVFQIDDEIAAANMALGVSFSEGIAVTGSSGGGIALMGEAVSFAGMAELPLVVYAAQRQGPSTGVPTYSGQGDLKFILNLGSGEFPRVVSVPGDAEEAFHRSAEASYLAKKFRTQSFILSDKHVAESYFSVPRLSVNRTFKKSFIIKPGQGYKSYAITGSGVSPSALPGGKVIVRATSYEHDEAGFTTEDSQMVSLMNEKRFKKIKAIKEEVAKFKPVSRYGVGKKLIIVAGSTKGAALDALPELPGVRVLQINYLEPFPAEEVRREIKKAEKAVTIESNTTGLLAQIIAEKTGFFVDSILKFDGRPFTAKEVVEKARKIFK